MIVINLFNKRLIGCVDFIAESYALCLLIVFVVYHCPVSGRGGICCNQKPLKNFAGNLVEDSLCRRRADLEKPGCLCISKACFHKLGNCLAVINAEAFAFVNIVVD